MELRQQIELQLRTVPGGRQIAPNEVAYDGGRFVVTFAYPGTTPLAAPDCPMDGSASTTKTTTSIRAAG
jgi:hypothetical protein